MRPFLYSASLVLLIGALSGSSAFAQVETGTQQTNRAGIAFFENKIRPVLVEHCYECHSGEPDEESAFFIADTREGLLQGGDSGKAVVPGNLKQSLILQALEHDPDFYAMPPDKRLPAQVVKDFQKWIQMGAPDPRKSQPTNGPLKKKSKLAIDFEKEREFWSFRPFKEIIIPEDQNKSWPTNAIDRFVLARLEKNGLTSVATADRRTLVRRVYFDLTGLPPTPKEIQQFWKINLQRLMSI